MKPLTNKNHPRPLDTAVDWAGRACLVLAIALGLASGVAGAAPLAATSPGLGAAGSYSVLAGTTVTNGGPSTMPGDVGVSPGTSITGFPPGIVGPPGTQHSADGSASSAQSASTAAFTALDQGCTTTFPGVKDLGGQTLGPGVYCADAFLLSGNLTLSGSGVWIFKSAATLTTAANSSISGGDPCNVWWRLVSSGTVGTGSRLIGNILALTSITLQTGASLDGRALAQTGAVTLQSNSITGPNCAQLPPPSGSPTPTPVPQPSHVDVSYPCSPDGQQVVISVGLSAGVIVYGLGPDITSGSDTGSNKIVRVLPFGHYDWHATAPAGHYLLDAASGAINPVVCASATGVPTTSATGVATASAAGVATTSATGVATAGPGSVATAGPTGVPVLIAATGGDLTENRALVTRQLLQGGLGFLGLGLVLVGLVLWRKRQ